MSDFQEKIEVKVFLNGREVAALDMGKPERSPNLMEDISCFRAGYICLTPQFRPYRFAVSISRPDNKKIRELLAKAINEGGQES